MAAPSPAVTRALETPTQYPLDPSTQTVLRQLTDAGIPAAAATIAQQQVAQTIADLVRAARLAERRAVVGEIQEAIDATPDAWVLIGNRGVERASLRAILVAADANMLRKGWETAR